MSVIATPKTRGRASLAIHEGNAKAINNYLKKHKATLSLFKEAKEAVNRIGTSTLYPNVEKIEKHIKRKLPFTTQALNAIGFYGLEGGKRQQTYKKQKKLSPRLIEGLENAGNILELLEVIGGGKTRRKAKKFTRRH